MLSGRKRWVGVRGGRPIAVLCGLASVVAGFGAGSAHAISLSVNGPSEALFTDGVSFTMSVDGVPDGVPRDVGIVDADSDVGIAGCWSLSSTPCTKHIDVDFPLADGDPVVKHYRFEATGDGETAQVTKSVTFSQPAWSLKLDGPDEVNAEDAIPLQVSSTPQAVSPYGIEVTDLDTQAPVGSCFTYIGTCTSHVRYLPLSSVPYVKHYVARMAAGSDVLASASHDVTVFPPNIGVRIEVPSLVLPGHTFTITVTSSVRYYLPWPIVVRDGQGNVIGSCRTDQTPCQFTVTAGAEGTARSFSAEVTDGTTTVSRTSSVTVHASDPLAAGTLAGAGPRATIDAVAAGFGSAAAVCNALLFIPGTHNVKATTTDQWLACDGIQQAGGTAELAIRAALGAMAGVVGAEAGQSLLDALQNYIWINYGDNSPPTTPPPPVPPPPTAPGPTPAPIASAIDDVAAALRARAATLTATEAATIAKECLYRVGLARLAAEDLCTRLPIFSPGVNHSTATQHRIDALEEWPAWVRLTNRIGRRLEWYRDEPECLNSTAAMPCDEFPENRTYEGGPPGATKRRPSLLKIPMTDNSGLGGSFSQFRIQCGLTDSQHFLVIPTAPALGISTKRICG